MHYSPCFTKRVKEPSLCLHSFCIFIPEPKKLPQGQRASLTTTKQPQRKIINWPQLGAGGFTPICPWPTCSPLRALSISLCCLSNCFSCWEEHNMALEEAPSPHPRYTRFNREGFYNLKSNLVIKKEALFSNSYICVYCLLISSI